MLHELKGNEFKIMLTLWDFKEPAAISDLQGHYKEIFPGQELNRNTANNILTKLVNKGIVELRGFGYFKNAITRVYSPKLTKEEYFAYFFGEDVEKRSFIQYLFGLIRDKDECQKVIDALTGQYGSADSSPVIGSSSLSKPKPALSESEPASRKKNVKVLKTVDYPSVLQKSNPSGQKNMMVAEAGSSYQPASKPKASKITSKEIVLQSEGLDPNRRKTWQEKIGRIMKDEPQNPDRNSIKEAKDQGNGAGSKSREQE